MRITEQTKLYIVEFGKPEDPQVSSGRWTTYEGGSGSKRISSAFVLAESYGQAAIKG